MVAEDLVGMVTDGLEFHTQDAKIGPGPHHYADVDVI